MVSALRGYSTREGQNDYEYILAHILERIFLTKISACNNFANGKRHTGFKELQVATYD